MPFVLYPFPFTEPASGCSELPLNRTELHVCSTDLPISRSELAVGLAAPALGCSELPVSLPEPAVLPAEPAARMAELPVRNAELPLLSCEAALPLPGKRLCSVRGDFVRLAGRGFVLSFYFVVACLCVLTPFDFAKRRLFFDMEGCGFCGLVIPVCEKDDVKIVW